jgi:hypothetical protein
LRFALAAGARSSIVDMQNPFEGPDNRGRGAT